MKISGPFAMPEDYAAVIGRIAEGWAQLEFQIDRGIWTLLRTQHQLAACVTAQLISVHIRMRAFIALVELHGGSEATLACLRSFSGKVSALQEKRNRAVHDPRAVDKASGIVNRLEMTAKPKITFGFEPEPIEILRDLHADIYKAVTDFSKLRDAAIAEVEALPAETRPQLLSIVEVRQPPSNPTEEQPTPPPPSESLQG
jgi:hypothetical protein